MLGSVYMLNVYSSPKIVGEGKLKLEICQQEICYVQMIDPAPQDKQ